MDVLPLYGPGMALTVAELADRALPASPTGDPDVTLRQVRYWTLGNVLQPIGGVYTGTGKHRRYDEVEAYFVALALELSRWRLQVGTIENIVRLLRDEYEGRGNPTRKKLRFVRGAIEGARGVFLFVRLADSSGTDMVDMKLGDYDEITKDIKEAGWVDDVPSFLSVNLSSLFAKVKRKR
jgi:hypothetical protein